MMRTKSLRGRPAARVLGVGLAWAALLLAPAARAAPALVVNAAAPDFTLAGMDGPNLRLREQRGSVVFVDFWASWCGPCAREIPHLNRLYARFRDAGFVLVGINVDDDPRNARGAAERFGVKFPVLLDEGKKVSALYDLGSMPASVLIDRDGRVRYVHRGFHDGDAEEYERQITELMKE